LIGADGEFVRFKTTHRTHYDAFTPTDPAIFDTLLWNERGELTEFTRGNVALRLPATDAHGDATHRWFTPPLASGLLPGIGRARALAEGRMEERVLRQDDLHEASAITFINSLRGWIEVDLE
jgi:para-aminobenzoate synthetase/4-amino-4-deoxychorismate lyase